ncbi:fatty acid desaturase [Marimonas lutisalis]|uniref:fatty acid desaturase n=1 Tax=Marimonas lutisalis TaxID=2545756 RepID=UPI0010F72DB7|nr:fatty acid desaturase [Marimonas lutisalis]
MDHRSFLKSLPDETAKTLTRRSDGPGLRHLAAHGGLIILVGAWIAAGWPLWWVLIPVQGVLIVFLFTLEHEATHKTPFANEMLNEWVGRICGVLLLLPFEWFRYFHLAHHRYTNIPGKDPELGPDDRKLDALGPWLWHVSGLPYWGAMARQLIVNAMDRAKADYLPPRVLPRIAREARIMLAVYAAAAVSLVVIPLLFWVWILPVLLGQPFLRLYLLAEHGRCPRVVNMFDNTRTTYTNAVVRFLAWNMPYHTEHHVHPAVPFFRLPEMNRLMKAHLMHEEDGYARFTRETLARF